MSSETLALAKAMHWANAAAAQFDLVVVEGGHKGESKKFFAMRARECRIPVNQILARMKGDAMAILKTELLDAHRLDAFVSMLMQLNEEGWAEAEKAVEAIVLGNVPGEAAPVADKCEKCDQQGSAQMHTCPLRTEIKDNYTLCNCCSACEDECSQEM